MERFGTDWYQFVQIHKKCDSSGLDQNLQKCQKKTECIVSISDFGTVGPIFINDMLWKSMYSSVCTKSATKAGYTGVSLE